MILSDHQITEYYKKGEILVDPFDEGQIQPASYDLRVGAQAVTTSSDGVIDLAAKKYVVLKPGDFAIVISHEVIRLGPQYVARFGLRSSLARKGLIATTGPQIDPGFHGRLIIGITNLTPQDISITHLDKFLTVEFHRLEQAALKPYDGKYQHRMELTAEEISIIAEKDGIPLVKVMESMDQLKKEVHGLNKTQELLLWLIGSGFALLAIVLALK